MTLRELYKTNARWTLRTLVIVRTVGGTKVEGIELGDALILYGDIQVLWFRDDYITLES